MEFRRRGHEAAGCSHRNIFWLWVILVTISALCAGLGYAIIHWQPGATRLGIQAFVAGAMLTMLADVMTPEAFEHGGKLVGLFTVLGFLLAVVLAAMQ
jgi:zinc transporter, ZIP family